MPAKRLDEENAVIITVATKVSAAEKAQMIEEYGTPYAALRAGVDHLLHPIHTKGPEA